ncbi:3-isopropylmalate dehydratase [candidate division KSB1 bacterium]
MAYSHVIRGRAWVITAPDGGLFANIDTDMIFHNSYLAITDINEMGQYIFDNLEGWENFAEKAQPGDIVIAGPNFGCGSSRQQAVDGFRALGIQAIVADSFGAIYFRNAVNIGFPLVRCQGKLKVDSVKNMSEIEINFESGNITDPADGTTLVEALPMSPVQKSIMEAGSLYAYGRTALG